MDALNNDQIKLIGVTCKKVTPPGPNADGGNRKSRKPPKYFSDFANQMLHFVNEQRQFNKLIIDRLDKLDARINNLVNKNNLKE